MVGTCPSLFPFGTLLLVCFSFTPWTVTNGIQVSESRHEQEIQCEKSRIDHNVTLASGHHAGVFLKANKSIVTMKRCLQQCCQMKGCDVAFFSNGACYSVKCTSLDTCAPTMNSDKGMMLAISYVAKPKVITGYASADNNVEREVTDNLIAEVTRESPFMDDDNFDQTIIPTTVHSTLRETKDAILAVICGSVAVAVGVAGVIIMTRRLVDEDEHFPFNSPALPKTHHRNGGGDILPTISEECDDDEHEPLLNHDLDDLGNIECGNALPGVSEPPDGGCSSQLNTISEDDNEKE